MPSVIVSYRNNPARILLRVPLGEDFAAVADAVKELESYLKSRYPNIREVSIRLRNPTPPPDLVYSVNYAFFTEYLHDATLVLAFTGKAVAGAVLVTITRDVVDFLKKRVKKIKFGRAKKRAVSRGRAKPRRKGKSGAN